MGKRGKNAVTDFHLMKTIYGHGKKGWSNLSWMPYDPCFTIITFYALGIKEKCSQDISIYTGRQVLERDSNWNGVQNTNLHLAYLRNSAEIKSLPSTLIGSWRPYDCDVTHTWVNGTVPIAVAAVFGGFLTFIWFCYLIYATITSNNDGDRRKIAMPFMTNYVGNCTVS